MKVEAAEDVDDVWLVEHARQVRKPLRSPVVFMDCQAVQEILSVALPDTIPLAVREIHTVLGKISIH